MLEKLSVIIPVYNSQNYLKRCLDSVVNQKYENFEIILINDGSYDNSEKICKDYMNKYDNIVYMYKDNEGPGIARKVGLDLATGKYISFVDSDDFIHEDMYVKMIEELKKKDADIVQCGYFRSDSRGVNVAEKKFTDRKLEIIGTYNSSLEFVKRKLVSPYLCNKIFRKDLFYKLHNPLLYYAEDQYMLAQVFNKCKKMIILPESYYYYVMEPDSLVRKDFNIHHLDGIKSAKLMYKYYKEECKELAPFISRIICYYIVSFYQPLKYSTISKKDEILRNFKRDFVNYYKELKNSKAYIEMPYRLKILFMLSNINLLLTSFFLNIYRRIVFRKR